MSDLNKNDVKARYFANKNIVITGVTSGIGLSITHLLLKQGAIVYGIARNQDKLNDIKTKYPDNFIPVEADLSDDSGWHDVANKLSGSIDTVILNAGTCEYMENGLVDVDLIKRVFDINFFANISAAKLFLNENKWSVKQYCVVSSSAHFFAMPRGEAYGASKAALSYFYESLQLSHPDIAFSIVHPGFVETPLTDKNDFDMPFKITSYKAADIIVKGLMKKKKQINFPWLFMFILKTLGKLPSSLRYKLGKGMVKK